MVRLQELGRTDAIRTSGGLGSSKFLNAHYKVLTSSPTYPMRVVAAYE